MQVKIDAIDNGYTLTYWAGEKYSTIFAGAWDETSAKAKELLHQPEADKPQGKRAKSQ